MVYYLAIKHIHMLCVALSGLLFVFRGCLMLANSPRLQSTWLKVTPHVVDSVLLLAGVTLVIISHQYPGQQPWLTAKLIGLVIYIVLGTIALKRGRTKRTRVLALIAALAVFAWIICVAITRNPLPFM